MKATVQGMMEPLLESETISSKLRQFTNTPFPRNWSVAQGNDYLDFFQS